jgi:hypothetical protein
MRLIDQTEHACHLRMVQYFKCRDDKKHEFLIVEIEHDKTKSLTHVLVDRAPKNPSGNETPSKRTAQMVSSSIPAEDSIRIQGSQSQSPLAHEFTPYELLATLKFGQRPPLLHFTTLLDVVHTHAPSYDLYHHQCYWFAHTIWQMLSSNEYQPTLTMEANWKARGTYKDVSVGSDSLLEIQREYQDALAKLRSEMRDKKAKADERDKQVCHEPYR